MMRAVLGWVRRPPVGAKLVILVVATLLYAASGFLYFERPGKPELSWLDSLWWALVTMSTLGYGDYFPVTSSGRFIIAYPVILIGLGFLAVAMSNFATFFIRADALGRKGLAMLQVKNHVLLIHFPSIDTVLRVARELRRQDASAQLVVVDADLEELPAILAGEGCLYVRGNPTLHATMESACLAQAKSVIVLARDPKDVRSDDAAVSAVLTVKAVRRDLFVVAECVEPTSEEVLRRAGADSIVCVANLAPGILAHESTDPGVATVLHELTVWGADETNIYFVPVTLKTGGATVEALRQHCQQRGATLIGVRRGKRIELNPKVDGAVASGDAALVMCVERPAEVAL